MGQSDVPRCFFFVPEFSQNSAVVVTLGRAQLQKLVKNSCIRLIKL